MQPEVHLTRNDLNPRYEQARSSEQVILAKICGPDTLIRERAVQCLPFPTLNATPPTHPHLLVLYMLTLSPYLFCKPRCRSKRFPPSGFIKSQIVNPKPKTYALADSKASASDSPVLGRICAPETSTGAARRELPGVPYSIFDNAMCV
jgi:hypothetical protein